MNKKIVYLVVPDERGLLVATQKATTDEHQRTADRAVVVISSVTGQVMLVWDAENLCYQAVVFDHLPDYTHLTASEVAEAMRSALETLLAGIFDENLRFETHIDVAANPALIVGVANLSNPLEQRIRRLMANDRPPRVAFVMRTELARPRFKVNGFGLGETIHLLTDKSGKLSV